LKILHIIPSLNIGGAEKVLINLINYHKHNNDFNHSVIVLQKKGSLGNEIMNSSIQIYELKLYSLLDLPLVFFKLIKHLNNNKYDIVQTWMYHSDLIGGLAAYFTGNKNIIWSIRNSEILNKGGISKSAIFTTKLCSLLSDFIPKVIFYNSEKGKIHHEEIGYDSSKSIIIPNPITIPSFVLNRTSDKYINTNKIIIGSVGRFNYYKDHKTFIKAASILLDKSNNFIFVLIGRGNNIDNLTLKGYINETKFKDNFILLDEVSDIYNYYQSFDVFCLHSISEGFPNVLAEAMLSGCLCVTTDVGDAKIIISDYGIVVNKSSPLDLANAIQKLINLSDINKTLMKNGATKRIQDYYSEFTIYPKFEKMYKNLIS
jgi:glycosyltransferase involved in cell wall biosynthesis